jgi:nucleotide-binding universal stress UspA family protein
MTDIIAVAPGSPDRVGLVATALADALGCPLRTLPPVDQVTDEVILEAMADPSCRLAVLPTTADAAGTMWRVLTRASKPVVLVPPSIGRPDGRSISRVLLPLDGSAEAAHAVEWSVQLLASSGVDLVVLHVFDEARSPQFWDQTAHAHQAWATEFLARHAPLGARLEVRVGVPGEQIVDVARTQDADLIALAWSQRLDAGRAATVRDAVLHAGVPILLVPLAADQ